MSYSPSNVSAVSVQSGDYTILDNDGFEVIMFDDTSSDRTCNLPTAADNKYRVITLMNTSTDKGKITVTPESGTIAGYSTIDLDCKGARIKIVSDGSNWEVI